LQVPEKVGTVHVVTLTRALIPLAVLPLLLAGCGSGSASASKPAASGGKRLIVASTVAPITSIVANIGGDRIELHGIVPEGTNSHTYEPPPQVATLLSDADLVFVNGLKLEDPTQELAGSNAKKGSAIVALGTLSLPASEYIYDFSFPKKDGKPNPHLWTDPLFAIKYADEAAAALSKHDPANKDYYETNRVAFDKRATALSDALKTAQATIPGGKKELLTYHDAYAYFGKDYGWKILGAVQPSYFEDPTPQEVAKLIDQVRTEKVPVIFGSEVFPSKILKQISQETGARYEDTLRDDDLPGKPGDAEHSWLGLMRYDYRTMVKGLGGDPAALDAVSTANVAPDKADYPQ
jgi:ABC-type Zn uptake system ZnuABC Zn-binding protein ZnuA